jgi:hypothetical protein
MKREKLARGYLQFPSYNYTKGFVDMKLEVSKRGGVDGELSGVGKPGQRRRLHVILQIGRCQQL